MAKILGLDYGEKRVGVAVSDPDGVIAMAHSVFDRDGGSGKALIEEIVRICRETGVEKVVVGLPINMNGTKGPMAEKIEAFAANLTGAVGLPVEKWDERLSTSMAERTLLEADMSRSKRKKVRDKMSAQVILQGYLDAANERSVQGERT
jgi:putative Holliday junction resolvase